MQDTPKNKTSEKRNRIVEAGAELFRKHGIRRITVEEICREAGASKMTFYKYFENKYELLKHIWNTWIDEGYATLEEIDTMDIPFTDKLQKIIEYKSEQLSRVSAEYMDEVLHGDPELTEFMRHAQSRNAELFLAFLKKAQARGDMRKIRPEFLMAALDNLNEIARDDKLASLYPSHVEFIQEIQMFLFYGILPTKSGDEEPTDRPDRIPLI
ncbi:MAG: TetR/AcrR family transcriptional regulator [Candidatus Latescibacterota bacterium]|nr:MAG: TetR/AcrR family transcriptional regulator [Candidatus Latescibacterota bacterium]